MKVNMQVKNEDAASRYLKVVMSTDTYRQINASESITFLAIVVGKYGYQIENMVHGDEMSSSWHIDTSLCKIRRF